ncbi:2,3-bisphosphoglycerate-independent phosphoglycerate mutase [Candidatus Uhrbacteria bacterium]|nr:2,3-bisphosphoglycerate-independent phosphoglycerate mutase [Candidatus Uhrbacteria bacterium]
MNEKSPVKHRPAVLIILDGWGIAPASRANAITEAKTPNFDGLVSTYPTAVLQASGEATGLPWGEAGNSEVGHMSIGAGRIVFQDLSRINASITDGSFFENEELCAAFVHAKKNASTVHCIGMVSASGVHSHIEHLFALIELATRKGCEKLVIHAFLDGRDTPFSSGAGYIEALNERMQQTPFAIASLSGRQYAMDRDNHWDRTEKAYRALTSGTAERTAPDALLAIRNSYAQGTYDEEFVPTVITRADAPVGCVANNDALIFFNFRADRARQIVHAFAAPSFDKFERRQFSNLSITTLTNYDATLDVHVAFKPQNITDSLSQLISAHGLTQLHVAETEKYAHITYFLNDGREQPFAGEDRVMIPSPHVESYAQKPEMSALEITDAVINAIQKNTHDVIAVNYANADMVGHTGDMKATISAVEVLDKCMKRVVDAVLAKSGCAIITADHGNAEGLLDLHTGLIDKEHSNNPVPCILIARELEGRVLDARDLSSKDLSTVEPQGMLSDVAPTLLALLEIEQPSAMSGQNLLLLS